MIRDFDEINKVLDEMAQDGTLEPMIEPIDDPSVQVDFWDWVDVLGIADEFVPEYMLDENGKTWIVQ